MSSRPVITGVSVQTAAGDDVREVARCIARHTPAHSWQVEEPFPEGLAGAAPLLRVPVPSAESLGGLKRPFPDRLCLLAISVVDRALRAAQLDGDGGRPRVGLVVNTCFGPTATVEKYLRTLLLEGPDHVSAITFSRTVANAVLGELSRRHGLLGPSTLVIGSTALGYAADLVAEGRADAVVTLGIDLLSDYATWAYDSAGMLAGGLLLGEGAAAVVLEQPAFAARRGARAATEVCGYGAAFCAEAVRHITGFTAPAIRAVVSRALARCELPAGAIDLWTLLHSGDRGLAAAEREALSALAGADFRWLAPKLTLSETFGSSELLAAAVASTLIETGEARTVMVNAGQLGGALASTVLRRVDA